MQKFLYQINLLTCTYTHTLKCVQNVTFDLAEAFPFFVAVVVLVVELEDSTASLGDCLLAAALEDALLLGGGAVGLCFSSKPTTTCLEAGCIIQYHHNNQTSLKQECTRDVQDNSMYTPVYSTQCARSNITQFK